MEFLPKKDCGPSRQSRRNYGKLCVSCEQMVMMRPQRHTSTTRSRSKPSHRHDGGWRRRVHCTVYTRISLQEEFVTVEFVQSKTLLNLLGTTTVLIRHNDLLIQKDETEFNSIILPQEYSQAMPSSFVPFPSFFVPLPSAHSAIPSCNGLGSVFNVIEFFVFNSAGMRPLVCPCLGAAIDAHLNLTVTASHTPPSFKTQRKSRKRSWTGRTSKKMSWKVPCKIPIKLRATQFPWSGVCVRSSTHFPILQIAPHAQLPKIDHWMHLCAITHSTKIRLQVQVRITPSRTAIVCDKVRKHRILAATLKWCLAPTIH